MRFATTRSIGCGLLIGAMIVPAAETSKKWESLLKDSPFSGPPSEVQPEAQPQLELRGLVVEDGVRWFTFLDIGSKKWTTVREGDGGAPFVVRNYDRERDAVTLELQGKLVSIALKLPVNSSKDSGPSVGTALAAYQSATPPGTVRLAVASLPSKSESRRLELVAEEVRQRRERRSKQTGQAAVSES